MAEGKKHRSPSYPYLDLEEAVSRLELIYKQDKKSPTSRTAVLEHMGYSTSGKEGKSGSGGRALSALRQYGLIDETNGLYKVSEAGFRILHLEHGTDQWMALVKEAATKPSLFVRLLTRYAFDLPSDISLRDHLLTEEGFNPDSVSGVIRTLRKTIEFAKLSYNDYAKASVDDDDYIEGEIVETQPMPSQDIQRPANIIFPVPSAQQQQGAPYHVFSYQLSFPRNIRAEVIIYGSDLRKADIVRLQNEVGDLAGAFDDDVTETDSTQ